MKIVKSKAFQQFCYWGLKLALAVAFLSAVADRLGLWGAPGSPNVTWGDLPHFISYTQALNPWSPPQFTPILAWIATILETFLGVMILTTVKTRLIAFISGCLLSLYAIAMILTTGPKSAFDYSVFTAAFAAFFLASKE